MHRSRSGQSRQFHQSQLLEKIEPPDSFRRPEWSLTAALQMPDEALADEPVDLPVNVSAVSEGKVVRPPFQVPVQLIDQHRDRLETLMTVGHFAPAPQNHRRTAPASPRHSAPALAGRGTTHQTSAGRDSPTAARSPHLAAFLSSVGSLSPSLPYPSSALPQRPAATCESLSAHCDPPPACAHTPLADRAESNRNSLSGRRHIQPDTRPLCALVSPPAPDAPSVPVGTHNCNRGNPLQRSAPESTGLPSALPGPSPSEFPTASASHSPSVCRRAAPPPAGRFCCATLPESLPENPPRPNRSPRSARS